MRFLGRSVIVLTLFLAFVFTLDAQNNNTVVSGQKDSILNKMTNIEMKVKEYAVSDSVITDEPTIYEIIDSVLLRFDKTSLFVHERDTSGIIKMPQNNWIPFDNTLTFGDTIIYNPVFLPVVFDGNLFPEGLDFLKKKDDFLSGRGKKDFHLIDPDSTFAPQLAENRRVEETRRNYFVGNPERVRLNAFTFDRITVIDDNVIKKTNPLITLISTEDPITVAPPDLEVVKAKPVHWLKNGEHRLQISFNTYSKNWGGDNNFDLFSHQKFNINFKKGKVRMDNLVEWRLQLKQITSFEDKDKPENKNKGKINVIEDYLRSYSIVKLDAIKNWAYSANLEMKTPVLTKKTNEAVRKWQRAFLSPFELNSGIGMSYGMERQSKADKYRKFKVNADISALSINFKSVSNDSILATDFGIEKDRTSKTEFGSTFNVNLSYSYNRYIKYTTRIKYFTNYKNNGGYAEWENSFDFALNSYFSTTLYLYLKYDESLAPEKTNNDKIWKYFNYNQMIRFGLTYTW